MKTRKRYSVRSVNAPRFTFSYEVSQGVVTPKVEETETETTFYAVLSTPIAAVS